MTRRLSASLWLALSLLLAGCIGSPEARLDTPPADEIAQLAAGFQALGAAVDPVEADRLAMIAHTYSQEQARRYNVTTRPLTHNTLVNMGLRERGLCHHFADDLHERVKGEGFETLAFTRALANHTSPWRYEHSALIVTLPGAPISQGIVLDGWRNGGELFWARTPEDTRYAWVEIQQAFVERRASREASPVRALLANFAWLS
ncbi:MAG: hypothetical protein AAGJ96_04830 [Pseudomonadota bacterium]